LFSLYFEGITSNWIRSEKDKFCHKEKLLLQLNCNPQRTNLRIGLAINVRRYQLNN
jgi:hypothetical protein